jgi:hypothetical protein
MKAKEHSSPLSKLESQVRFVFIVIHSLPLSIMIVHFYLIIETIDKIF